MMELSGKVSGKIAVGIIPSTTNSVLPDVLSRFGAKYPDVEIRIDEAYSGTLIDWVVSGDLDIAAADLPLQTRRIIEPKLTRELVYVYRAQRPLSLAVKSFIALLSEELRRALGQETTAGRRDVVGS
jgi:LysR family nitrogen assimilation transcriptional regulator